MTGDDLLLAIASAREPAAQIEAGLVLDWVFGRQPESTRTMAVLHYVDGLTLEEVARQTGLSVSWHLWLPASAGSSSRAIATERTQATILVYV